MGMYCMPRSAVVLQMKRDMLKEYPARILEERWDVESVQKKETWSRQPKTQYNTMQQDKSLCVKIY